MFDAVVVGGSYAGMSAALQLVRARRRVLVVDAGAPRNRFASHSHGFLTQDGVAPQRMAADAREQLMNYSTAEWRVGRVAAVQGRVDEFSVRLDDGRPVGARRIILACGVRDELPAIPGLAEQWGRHVFHCPYCHGYELGRRGIGVLACSALAIHQALMLPDWGETTLFLNEVFAPDAAQHAQLEARGVGVEPGAVEQVEARDETAPGLRLVLQGGRRFELAGLFVAPRLHLDSVITQLGCALSESPMGPVVETDAMQATSIPGILACGDVARAAGSVTFAVADGAAAGLSAHRSLMFGL